MDLSAFPYLQNNYAPVEEERDLAEDQLRVEGEVPRKLVGAYMRDGANVAFQPNHMSTPWTVMAWYMPSTSRTGM